MQTHQKQTQLLCPLLAVAQFSQLVADEVHLRGVRQVLVVVVGVLLRLLQDEFDQDDALALVCFVTVQVVAQ